MSRVATRDSLQRNDRRALFVPNAKQWEWCSTTALECLLSGPNQHGGKTYTLRYLLATHATGDYPEEWTGPRFDDPPVIIVVSPTHEGNRDQIIHHLFSEQFETSDINGPGWIRPHEYDAKDLAKIGIPRNSISTARVIHLGRDRKPNGKSLILFTSYFSGIRRIAGLTADLVLGNELPEIGIYSEMKARINAVKPRKSADNPKQGIVRIVGCPLEEDPEVFYMFKDAEDPAVMKLIEYSITDCAHVAPEIIASEIARWKDHPEAEARLYGRPCRGSGLIFPYPLTSYAVPPEKPDESFPRIIGLDLPLIGGTFAAVNLAWDRESDIVYVYNEFKESGQEWPVYAHRVKIMGGDKIPISWPKDGGIKVEATGTETRVDRLRSLGLNMLSEHAFFWAGTKRSDSKMAMIDEAQERITTGRLKISRSCPQIIDEMRRWRTKDGKVRKNQVDHLIDAMLKGLMMKRYARVIGPETEPWRVHPSQRFQVEDKRRFKPGGYDFFSEASDW